MNSFALISGLASILFILLILSILYIKQLHNANLGAQKQIANLQSTIYDLEVSLEEETRTKNSHLSLLCEIKDSLESI